MESFSILRFPGSAHVPVGISVFRSSFSVLRLLHLLVWSEAVVVGVLSLARLILRLVEPLVRQLQKIVKQCDYEAEKQCIAERVDLERPYYRRRHLYYQGVDDKDEKSQADDSERQRNKNKYRAYKVVQQRDNQSREDGHSNAVAFNADTRKDADGDDDGKREDNGPHHEPRRSRLPFLMI